MVAITVDETNVGQIIATQGILTDVVLKTTPTRYGDDYLLVVDQLITQDEALNDVVLSETQLYNRCISKAFVSVDSILFTNGKYPFANLVVKTIPPGCSIEITTADPPAVPTLTALVPDTYASHGSSFTLTCEGTSFDANTVIIFGGFDVPTVMISDTEVYTTIKPNQYLTDTYPVQIRIDLFYTNSLDFTFT